MGFDVGVVPSTLTAGALLTHWARRCSWRGRRHGLHPLRALLLLRQAGPHRRLDAQPGHLARTATTRPPRPATRSSTSSADDSLAAAAEDSSFSLVDAKPPPKHPRFGPKWRFNQRPSSPSAATRRSRPRREAEKESACRERHYQNHRSHHHQGFRGNQHLRTFVCGAVDSYDRAYDRVNPKTACRLERFKNRQFFKITTTEDPIIRRLAEQDNVGNKLFFDKREGSQLDLLTVNETAQEQLPENKDDINSAPALAVEATYINQNFAAGAVHAAGVDPSGARQFLTLNALNEFDPKITGVDWKQKLESQRGAVLATELKNNANKLARWTASGFAIWR
ncbi:hypothetical protein ZWY2020_045250 [Hordeum vulgare]|nr:hypothetical protein ZWY2020_045250 [Hordeum vulgare]